MAAVTPDAEEAVQNLLSATLFVFAVAALVYGVSFVFAAADLITWPAWLP